MMTEYRLVPIDVLAAAQIMLIDTPLGDTIAEIISSPNGVIRQIRPVDRELMNAEMALRRVDGAPLVETAFDWPVGDAPAFMFEPAPPLHNLFDDYEEGGPPVPRVTWRNILEAVLIVGLAGALVATIIGIASPIIDMLLAGGTR